MSSDLKIFYSYGTGALVESGDRKHPMIGWAPLGLHSFNKAHGRVWLTQKKKKTCASLWVQLTIVLNSCNEIDRMSPDFFQFHLLREYR